MAHRAPLLVALIATAPVVGCSNSDSSNGDDSGPGNADSAFDGTLQAARDGGDATSDGSADSARDTNVPDGAPPPCAPDAKLPDPPTTGPTPTTDTTAILAESGVTTTPIPAL